MRFSRYSLALCALIGATGIAAAENFAEREFPELKAKRPPMTAAAVDKPAPMVISQPVDLAAPKPEAKPKVRIIPLSEQRRPAPVAPAELELPAPAPVIAAPAARPARDVAIRPARLHQARQLPPRKALPRRDYGVELSALRRAPEGNEIHTGYGDVRPSSAAWVDATGYNGAPQFRAADQQRSYVKNCGNVYHRFFDENGAEVDRPIRVCN